MARLLLLSFLGATSAAVVTDQQNPVSRTVELLEDLSKQAEKDGKAEEGLYEKFVCWATSVIDTKTASNAEAATRVQELETYVSDLQAGRIELTTERTDLEKDLQGVTTGIEDATAMREKEHADFVAGEEEMVRATTALAEAIQVLDEATENHTTGVFIEQGRGAAAAGEGFARGAQHSADLAHATELATQVLSKGDAFFLRRLLTGVAAPDVPAPDWKKLNRKATFKKSYKARSFKIQGILQTLNVTISATLADARIKEEKAQALHDKLMASKNEEKLGAEEALNLMAVENGAKSLSKEEANAEIAQLRDQVANDEKFVEETTTSLTEKKAEWRDRSNLRAEEIAAISKAIQILRNDDARDLMKRSFASQAKSFLQLKSRRVHATDTSSHEVRSNAAAVLRRAAAAAGSPGLSMLAGALKGGHFDEVLGAIDKMIAVLGTEETSDLESKERCEKDNANSTREAAVTSRTMDEQTDEINKLKSDIQDIDTKIQEKKDAVAQTTAEVAEATTRRGEEKTEWTASDADDKEAKATVERAKNVLDSFYTNNNLMLLQKQKQPELEAGKAPPPPPTTWDAPYGGKTGESTGILSILGVIAADIQKDMDKARAAEEKAATEFVLFKKTATKQIGDLNGAVDELTGVKGNKQENIAQKKTARTDSGEQLGAVMKAIADAKKGCDYITVNFAARTQNRQIEVDGLQKAKALLKGAVFGGDSLFLQIRRHGH